MPAVSFRHNIEQSKGRLESVFANKNNPTEEMQKSATTAVSADVNPIVNANSSNTVADCFMPPLSTTMPNPPSRELILGKIQQLRDFPPSSNDTGLSFNSSINLFVEALLYILDKVLPAQERAVALMQKAQNTLTNSSFTSLEATIKVGMGMAANAETQMKNDAYQQEAAAFIQAAGALASAAGIGLSTLKTNKEEEAGFKTGQERLGSAEKLLAEEKDVLAKIGDPSDLEKMLSENKAENDKADFAAESSVKKQADNYEKFATRARKDVEEDQLSGKAIKEFNQKRETFETNNGLVDKSGKFVSDGITALKDDHDKMTDLLTKRPEKLAVKSSDPTMQKAADKALESLKTTAANGKECYNFFNHNEKSDETVAVLEEKDATGAGTGKFYLAKINKDNKFTRLSDVDGVDKTYYDSLLDNTSYCVTNRAALARVSSFRADELKDAMDALPTNLKLSMRGDDVELANDEAGIKSEMTQVDKELSIANNDMRQLRVKQEAIELNRQAINKRDEADTLNQDAETRRLRANQARDDARQAKEVANAAFAEMGKGKNTEIDNLRKVYNGAKNKAEEADSAAVKAESVAQEAEEKATAAENAAQIAMQKATAAKNAANMSEADMSSNEADVKDMQLRIDNLSARRGKLDKRLTNSNKASERVKLTSDLSRQALQKLHKQGRYDLFYREGKTTTFICKEDKDFVLCRKADGESKEILGTITSTDDLENAYAEVTKNRSYLAKYSEAVKATAEETSIKPLSEEYPISEDQFKPQLAKAYNTVRSAKRASASLKTYTDKVKEYEGEGFGSNGYLVRGLQIATTARTRRAAFYQIIGQTVYAACMVFGGVLQGQATTQQAMAQYNSTASQLFAQAGMNLLNQSQSDKQQIDSAIADIITAVWQAVASTLQAAEEASRCQN